MNHNLSFLLAASIIVLILSLTSVVVAEEPNVGLLRIASVSRPTQLAPSTQFSLVADVEYAIRFKATVKATLFEGSRNTLGSELWESEAVDLSGGGDMIWTINLTAPSTEKEWSLVIFAYYLEDGNWNYHDDSYRGPGYAELTLKVARSASLEIDMEAPNIPITIDNSTKLTSSEGVVKLQLPIGVYHNIAVPSTLHLQNQTRLIFLGWKDGINDSQRTLRLDGDLRLAGAYATQYLLQVNSVASGTTNSTWYDAGSNVTLTVVPSFPMSWPLGSIGVRYVFRGWTGADDGSTSPEISITMNGPKVVTANFEADCTPVVVPAILAVGILGGMALAIARRRTRQPGSMTGSEELAGLCGSCGNPIQEEWLHCANCGKSLRSSETV